MSKYLMIPMDHAMDLICRCAKDQLVDVECQIVGYDQAIGRIAGQQIVSPSNFPAFRASVMDGFAICSSVDKDVGEFSVLDAKSLAGDQVHGEIREGEAMYVTTGAPVPSGTTSVVKIEDVLWVVENERIQVRVKNGMYIREVGSDIEKGQVVVEKNARIGPAEVGILAMLGISEVKVFRKIIVGVLSTGSELCKLESKSGALPQPSGGKIFDSNSVMLKCALEEFGVEVLEFGIIGDNAEFLEQKMEEIIPLVDILVTSGGVSMGIADLVKPYLEKKGKIVFGRLLMKPGKPATFAVVEDCNQKRKKMVFALPGNPVSCLVCLHLLVRPAIHILQGLEEFNLPRIKVVLGQEIKMDPERPEYHRALATFDPSRNAFLAISTGNQISSRLLSMHSANVLLEIPQGDKILRKGDQVSALLIGNLGNYQIPEQLITSNPKMGCSHHHHSASHMKKDASQNIFHVRIGLLVCSDRASSGERADKCIASFKERLNELESLKPSCTWEISRQIVTPDDQEAISKILCDWCDSKEESQTPHIIFTMGGTGFSVRDVTPEATKAVIDRECPGFNIAIMTESLKIVPTAMLSRAISGIRKKT